MRVVYWFVWLCQNRLPLTLTAYGGQTSCCGAISQSKFHFQFVLATLNFWLHIYSCAFEFVDVLFEAINESTNTKFHVKFEIIPNCFGCPCRLRWRKPNRSHKFNLQNDKIGRTACGRYNLIEIQGDISVIGMKNEFLLTNWFNFILFIGVVDVTSTLTFGIITISMWFPFDESQLKANSFPFIDNKSYGCKISLSDGPFWRPRFE